VVHWRFIALAVAATLGVLGASIVLELAHNVMGWNGPGIRRGTWLALGIYGASICVFIWASRAASSLRSAIALVALTLLLASVGILGLEPEHAGEPKPREPSPIEYRATKAALMCVPLLIAVTNVVLRRRRSTRA
jgi:hypothetical protein